MERRRSRRPAFWSRRGSPSCPTASTIRSWPRGSRTSGARPLADVVEAALEGVRRGGLAADRVAVQLREKDLLAGPLLELARPLRALTARDGIALYVNDRIDVALAVGADGVHLGGDALP